jgi:hypothetical protein
MKKIIVAGAFLIVIASLIIAGCIGTGPKPIQITYYYSSNCSDCVQMDAVFNNLSTKYNGEFILTKYDINKEQVKFYNDQITYHGDGSVPFVFISNLTLNGYQNGYETTLEYYIVHREEFMKYEINSTVSQR